MPWLLLVGLIVLLALNIPVAYAMLGISILYLVIRQDIPLILVAQQVAAGTDKFLLLAIPFFFLAAELMSSGGIMHRLVDLARAMVGHLRGGLGQMNVVGSMFFAGISGSAVADTAGMGRLEIEIMRRAIRTASRPRSRRLPRPSARSSRRASRWWSTAASPMSRSGGCSSPASCRAC
jgi:TRAP-type mannitol/chloroaromatic compound transport system permease large subunit